MTPEPELEPLADLGNLASAVSHHVINAFSAIVSNAEILRLLQDSEAPIDPASVADQIIKSALDAAGVARRLIDYTRPVTAIGDTPVLLHQLAEEVIEFERERTANRSNLIWSSSLQPVPAIKGHASRLREMMRHLINNAREALPPAGGTIRVSTSTDSRGWVTLEIQDNGDGMAPGVSERAVEPFFTTRSGHLGVGLPIANGIWRRHRGTLAIRSEFGEGTTVRLAVDPNPGQRL